MNTQQIEKRSWIASIILHALFVFWLVYEISHSVHIPAKTYVPIDVQLIAPPQPKVNVEEMVGKKGYTQTSTSKPTSLPGDRPQPLTDQTLSPVYPKKALNNEWEGTVQVKVTVSENGTPMQLTVVKSSGHDSLDQSFIRAIKQGYKFKPKRVMGKNVSGTIVISHTFNIKDE